MNVWALIAATLAPAPADWPIRAAGTVFFGGLGLVFLGLAALMAYEVVALWTSITPTISMITAFEYLRHPVWWVVIACAIAFALGALVTHFTHWTP